MKARVAPEVEAYLAALPPEGRATLEVVRQRVRTLVPDAEEVISYGIPTFDVGGRHLLSYAAFKQHCSLFPHDSEVIAALGAESAGYPLSKGTIRFPIGEPLPEALIGKIVRARLAKIGAARAG